MPDERSTIVFNNGTIKGLKELIPTGGHTLPNSGAGDSLLWKKAQKKETKKNTSEIINKIIPHRKPSSTIEEWWPWKVASCDTSFHHWYITKLIKKRPKKDNSHLKVKKAFTKPITKTKALTELTKGQGDSSTKW